MNKYILSILFFVSGASFAGYDNHNEYILNHTNHVTIQKHQKMLNFASTNYIDYISGLKSKSSKFTIDEQKNVDSLKSFFNQSIKDLCVNNKFDCNYN